MGGRISSTGNSLIIHREGPREEKNPEYSVEMLNASGDKLFERALIRLPGGPSANELDALRQELVNLNVADVPQTWEGLLGQFLLLNKEQTKKLEKWVENWTYLKDHFPAAYEELRNRVIKANLAQSGLPNFLESKKSVRGGGGELGPAPHRRRLLGASSELGDVMAPRGLEGLNTSLPSLSNPSSPLLLVAALAAMVVWLFWRQRGRRVPSRNEAGAKLLQHNTTEVNGIRPTYPPSPLHAHTRLHWLCSHAFEDFPASASRAFDPFNRPL